MSMVLTDEIFDNFPFPVVVYTAVDEGRDFVFSRVNNKCLEVEKIKLSDVIGKKITTCFPGVEDFGLLTIMRDVYRTGKRLHLPINLYEDEKTSGYRENWVYKLSDEELLIIYQDKDDYIKIYESFEEQKLMALRTSRLNTLGEMSASITHEIKNPLSLIIGRVNMLIKSYDRKIESGELEKDLKKIADAGKKIKEIMESVINFSRGEFSEKKELVNPNTIIDSSIPYLETDLKVKDIEFSIIRTEEKDVFVNCVPVQIQQVLTNFIKNSIDSVKDLPSRWIELKISMGEKDISFKVTDSGGALKEELISKLGNKLFTTKGKNGTGLGLYLCKKIASSHGGEVFIYNEKEHPVFELKIPLD